MGVVYLLMWAPMLKMLPPWNATLPVETIVGWWRENQHILGAIMAVMMVPQALYIVFGLGIAKVMRKAAGDKSIIVEMEIWGAGLGSVVGIVTMWIWMAGTYQPEALSDQILLFVYDAGWLMLDCVWPVTSMQIIAFGVGFLQDKREVPLVPKWACWYSIWIGVGFMAETLMPLFKSGAFARYGILNFWIEYGIFFLWFPIVIYYMLKAIPRLEQEARQGGG
jgi:hypothetical protein